MATSAWLPLAVARGGSFTSETNRANHPEDPPRNGAMYCRAEATETKRCAVGQLLAMYCRFAAPKAATLPKYGAMYLRWDEQDGFRRLGATSPGGPALRWLPQ